MRRRSRLRYLALILVVLAIPLAIGGSPKDTGAYHSPTLTHPVASKDFFRGVGVMVAWPEYAPPAEQLAAQLQAARVKWLAVRLHDGTTRVSELLERGWIEPFRARGIRVIGWGVLREAPEREANLASALLRRYRLSGYIANAEAEYKIDAGGVRRRALVFTRTFRALRPRLAACLSTFGAASGENVLGTTGDPNASVMDFASWYRSGFDLCPQAYLNETAEYSPEAVAAHALRSGWPLRQVHPTIGIYAGASGRVSVDQYLPLLREEHMGGFNVYLAEHLEAEDLAALEGYRDLDEYFSVIDPQRALDGP